MLSFYNSLSTRIFALTTLLHFLALEMKEVITSPAPIPIKIDAIKNNAEVLRNMNPTPIPIRVVPPMAHELLSLLLSTSNSSRIHLPH